MVHFTELDPAVALAAIEGHDNILDGAQKTADVFYRQFICPSCKGSALSKRFDPRHSFADPTWLIARATLVCNQCSCHFDPHSGLILEMGNPAKVESPIPIINPSSSR